MSEADAMAEWFEELRATLTERYIRIPFDDTLRARIKADIGAALRDAIASGIVPDYVDPEVTMTLFDSSYHQPTREMVIDPETGVKIPRGMHTVRVRPK